MRVAIGVVPLFVEVFGQELAFADGQMSIAQHLSGCTAGRA